MKRVMSMIAIEVPVSIIRNNLKTAGISRDEYFRLLAQ